MTAIYVLHDFFFLVVNFYASTQNIAVRINA